jgi:hypothetical protein
MYMELKFKAGIACAALAAAGSLAVSAPAWAQANEQFFPVMV